MANIADIVTEKLGKNLTYPTVQDISPIDAMLGHSVVLTPNITSGLPVTPVAVTNALVAEVIKAEPIVTENFSFSFGMGNAMVPMPRIGRNVYELPFTIYNGVPTYTSIYSFIELMSNANSLILCRTVCEGGDNATGGKTKKLVLRNTSIYQRPSFLGYLAGATDITEAHERISVLGSVDFVNTAIGDNFDSIVGTLANIFNITANNP